MKLDYLSIFERAWKITWRHKILWLFGLLSLSGSCNSGSGYNSSYSSSSGSGSSSSSRALQQAQEFFANYWPVLLVVLFVLIIVGIIVLVIGYIARGGLIHMASEFDSGSDPKAGEGFRKGSHYWLKLLGIDFTLFAPLVLLTLLVVGIIVLVAVLASPGILSSVTGGSSDAAAAAGSTVGAICCIFGVVGLLIVLMIPVVIYLGVLQVFAQRECVLDDKRVFDSIRASHRLIRTRFGDVALVWLIRLVIGMVIGIAMLLVGLVVIGIPAALILVNAIVGIVSMIPGVFVMILLAAVLEAFSSTAWTMAYRDLKATEPAAQPAPSTAPAT